MTNTLTRRSMLRATLIGTSAMLSSASVAAAAVPPFVFLDAPSGPDENPELIALGKTFPKLEAEYITARRARSAIVAKWSRLWPKAPDAIVLPYRDSNAWERDFMGAAMLPDGSRYQHRYGRDRFKSHPEPRSILSAESIEWQIERLDRSLHSRRPKHPLTAEQIAEIEAEIADLSAKLAVVREYEAAKVRVTKASGIAAATARLNAARDTLVAAVTAAMAAPETSMAGVLVKVRALQAWGAMHPGDRLDLAAMTEWPVQLADAVARHAA